MPASNRQAVLNLVTGPDEEDLMRRQALTDVGDADFDGMVNAIFADEPDSEYRTRIFEAAGLPLPVRTEVEVTSPTPDPLEGADDDELATDPQPNDPPVGGV